MRKACSIFSIICVVMVCIGLLFLSRSAFKQSPEVQLALTTDSNEVSVGEALQVHLSVKNIGESSLNNIELEIKIPDGLVLSKSSPESIRYWNSLSVGETISSYAITTVSHKPDEQILETKEPAIWVNKAEDFATKIAPLVVCASIIVFVIIFLMKKEGRVQVSLLLAVAILLGGLGPYFYNVISNAFFAREEAVSQTLYIDGEKTIVQGFIRYDKKEKSADKNKYYVVFDSNSKEEVAYQLVTEGECAQEPSRLEKQDYTFAGWYIDEDCKEKYSFDKMPVNKDMVLFAKWVDDSYGWDSDEDGICDRDEKIHGSDLYAYDDTSIDTDGDGLADYLEVYVYKTNPNEKDTDGDKLTDYEEVVLTLTNPNKVDSDANGVDDYNEDADSDGLINGEEVAIGTNPISHDSDEDGLDDYREVKEENTDPLLPDTDGDEACDGWEVANGYDPLKKDDKFDVSSSQISKDSSITAAVAISLKGDPQSVIVEEKVIENLLDSSMPGYVGSAFDFSTEGQFEEAVISFTFDRVNIPDDAELVIYYFNEETQLLEPMETTVTGNVASAVVSHFSTYVLLNKKLMDEVWENEILSPSSEEYKNSVFDIAFVIDYSASMNDNDPGNVRLDIVKQFVNKLRDNQDKASIIKFAAYATTLVPLSSDKVLLANAAGSISNASSSGCDSEAGTNGSDGLHAAIEELKNSASEGDYKYVIFLTDGEDTGTSYDYEALIADAVANQIVIFSIGMGDADEELLKHIAESTGGQYYYASAVDMEDTSAGGLMDAFYDIEISTIDLESDSNNDGISDYYTKLLCDGKLITGTGIPLFEGKTFEEIQRTDDYDGDGLPNGEEVIIRYDEECGKTYMVVVSSPIATDSDKDGIWDDEDTEPLKKGLAGGVVGKLTLVSCYNHEDSAWTSGHAFFVYTSYVNDKIDLSKLVPGWDRIDKGAVWSEDNIKKDDVATSEYTMVAEESMAIGNGAMDAELFDFIDDSGLFERSAGNGVSYNMEVYKHCSSEFGYSYLNNTYVAQDITERELLNLISYCGRSDVCYWTMTHNCAEVACQAWNRIADVQVNPYSGEFMLGLVATPKGLKNNMRNLSDYGENFDFAGSLGR